jgi:hypothetical protein
MATAEDIVQRAVRRLGLVDPTESVSGADLDHGLAALNEMISSWAADGLATADQTLPATVTSGSAEIAGLESTSTLAVGMYVTGTGIPTATLIKSIDGETTLTLTKAATASGETTLTFTALPFDARHEAGVVAMLAVRLAEDYGKTPAAVLVRDAERGEERLRAAFMTILPASFDTALTRTSMRVSRGDV